jgi:GT2 family glycosyltransferase
LENTALKIVNRASLTCQRAETASPAAWEPSLKPLSVSVVIPTYERGDILSETIAMALAQDYPDFEVIVVDQSRELPESVKKLVESAPERLRYLRLTTPNLPGARNAGVRIAKGEVISFIDDDVIIGTDYLTGMARRFHDPTVGAVMGMTLSPDGSEPSRENVLRAHGVKKEFEDGSAQIRWVVGCNSSYRTVAIIEAGMSDERFTGSAWSEDVDLAVRVECAGYRLIFDPKVSLTHLALPSGGCANRGADDRERKEQERCRLFLYFSFKNRAILGLPAVGLNVWKAYRSYTLGHRLIQTRDKLLKRQFRFIRNLAAAAAMCRDHENPCRSA